MVKVGIRQLKSRLSQYIAVVKAGEEVSITDRGEEVAIMVPVAETKIKKELLLMVKEGRASWGGGKPLGLATPIKAKGKPASQIVIEERR